MARIIIRVFSLLVLVPCAWADTDTSGWIPGSGVNQPQMDTTTVVIEQPNQAEPYMGHPYMDPPNPRTSYYYFPDYYRACCDRYRWNYGYGYYGGYRW